MHAHVVSLQLVPVPQVGSDADFVTAFAAPDKTLVIAFSAAEPPSSDAGLMPS